MGAGSRLGLLLAVAIAGIYPPSRPPGNHQPNEFETAICPGCERIIAKKVGARFYCQHCDNYFTAEEAAEPGAG